MWGTKVNQHSHGLESCPHTVLVAQRSPIHPNFIGHLVPKKACVIKEQVERLAN